MSGAHLHLALTHVPVLGILFGTVLLALALFRRHATLARVGFGTFAVAGIVAGIVYLTGEAAEEIVEGLPGVSEALIEAHEEAALVALIAASALGLLGLGGLLVFFRKAVPAWFGAVVFVLALGASGIMAWTANLGGQINHPEIRSEQAVSVEDAEHGGVYEDDD